jgi:hypothetical protein
MKRLTKEQEAQAFKRRHYDKVKQYKRLIPPSMIPYFHFPKIIGNDSFKGISKEALAVYPVICSRADYEENNWIKLSQEHIAILTGMDTVMVHRGVINLAKAQYILDSENRKIPLLQYEKITDGMQHLYRYRVGFVRTAMKEAFRGEYFAFHHVIITSHVWSRLDARAKALYLAMRTFAEFDAELYMDVEPTCTATAVTDFLDSEGGHFINRLWDPVFVPITKLCEKVHVARSNISGSINQLEHYGLVVRLGRYWKVYLRPDKMVR